MRINRVVSYLTTALAISVLGCSGAKPDLTKAEDVVKASLDKWKEGGKPQQLSDKSIEMTDPDWRAGMKLLDYQVKNASAPPQQGPRVVVRLDLQNRTGKKLNKEVAYEVLPGDKIRIGRDAFHVE